MQTYGSSVVPMIEANYEMFTVVEKTIADFFISNEKRWIFHRDAWQRCYMFQKHLCHALPRKWVTADTGSLFTTTSPRSRSDRMWRNRPSTSCIRMRNCCKNIQLNPRTTDQTCVPANRGTYAHFFVWIWQFWAGGTGVSTSVAAAWHGCGGNHGTAPDGIE